MSLSDCRLHVAVTPYQKRLVPDGVHVVDSSSFDPTNLLRCEWPPSHSCPRLPEGGRGGDIVAEQVLVSWIDNKLVYPVSFDAQPLAERRNDTQIVYHASFLAQLDGEVAYVPFPSGLPESAAVNGFGNIHNSFFVIVESPIAEVHAIRFAPTQAVIIEPHVKHSMPIPLYGNFEFAVWHRAVNAVLRQDADPAGVLPLVINLNKVDRVTPLSVRRIGPQSLVKRGQPKVKHLPEHFAKDLRALEEANPHDLAAYGHYIPDFAAHVEQVTAVQWPGAENIDGQAGVLEQDFLVTWRSPSDGADADSTLELEFEGLSGSFVGEKGRPGVEYNSELGVYKADLLMSRPDGSFFIQPSDHSSVFVMAFALPNAENGNPAEETLRIFIFRNGSTVRLEPRVWHSVPIPLASVNTGILFREVIAATNANLVINVKAESGHPIQFVQGI